MANTTLEDEKLQYEIKELKRNSHWFNRSWNKAASLLTLAVSVATVLFLKQGGAFEFQTKKLEAKEAKLAVDVARLDFEVARLEVRKEALTNDSIRLLNENQSLISRNKLLSEKLNNSIEKQSQIQQQIANFQRNKRLSDAAMKAMILGGDSLLLAERASQKDIQNKLEQFNLQKWQNRYKIEQFLKGELTKVNLELGVCRKKLDECQSKEKN